MREWLCLVGLLIGVITLLPSVAPDDASDRLVREIVDLLEKDVGSDRHPEEEMTKSKYLVKDELDSLGPYQEKDELDTDNTKSDKGGQGDDKARDWEKIAAMLEDTTKADEITTWVKHMNKAMRIWNQKEALAEWNYETNVTQYNADKKTEVFLQSAKWNMLIEKQAKKYYDEVKDDKTGAYSEQIVRALKFASMSAKSKDASKRKALEDVQNELSMIYGTATVTDKTGKTFHMEPDLEEVMARSRDYNTLLWAWQSWREVTGKQMKPLFTKMAKLLNDSATENGYKDYGNYLRLANFEQDDIEQEADRLVLEIMPLYKQIHAYVRSKLKEKYPEANIRDDGPIPAHLIGNMWGQQWDNILDIVTPYPESPTAAVTADLIDQGYDAHRMFKTAEEFYTSIGLDAMTDEFWKNSMIVQPTDGRTVQCHGSASEMHDEKHQDFRIKMCTHVTQDDLQTIHHEMGHVEYYQQYKDQPEIFHSGANSAFHEAVGDTIALSVMTPDHLKVIGLLKESKVTPQEQYRRDINFLMQMALAKVMFLPYAYILDKWRWDVYRGQIKPEEYNAKWWKYRHDYQGLEPPVKRTEEGFDPGAKYHVAANVGYIRYFFSFVGQFQFHKALCEAKGVTEDFHHCDIYRSKEAGKKLKRMLSLGSSRPWPKAMKLMTGKSKFESSAILKYFKPLQDWLKKQKIQHIGWK